MFCAVLLSLILLCLMIGIQQQNNALIVTSTIYLITITVMQRWNVKDIAYIYSLVIFLIILISWMLFQKYPMTEGFGTPSRPCTMYFTTDKEGCDKGYYTLSDADFKKIYDQQAILVNNTPITASNYNTVKQQLELLNKIQENRVKLNKNEINVCKQEFPGWLEDPDQPEKIPYDDIKNRGALRDWAFCYRNIVPTGTPTALYNPGDVQNNYTSLINDFGERTIASIDKTVFIQNPKNTTGVTVYSKATPEYARIYFKDWKADPDASCKNPAVSYVPSLISIPEISSRYGIEIGLTSNQNAITTISIVRPSPFNYNQMLYIGDYNAPDLNYIEAMFFDYVVVAQGLMLRPKAAIDTYLYRFYKDLCGRLMVPPTLALNTKQRATWNMTLPNNNYNKMVLSSLDYPFGQALPSEIINDNYWKLLNASFNNVNLNTILPISSSIYTINQIRTILSNQTNKLDMFRVNITETEDPTTSVPVRGFAQMVYHIPNKYDNYRVRTAADFNKFEEDLSLVAYLQNITPSLKDEVSIPLPLTRNVSIYSKYTSTIQIATPGKYEFKLVFSPVNNLTNYPLDTAIQVDIGNTTVASYYNCDTYNQCTSNINLVKCKPNQECPIPLITDLQNKVAPLKDASLSVYDPKKIHNPITYEFLTSNEQKPMTIQVFKNKSNKTEPLTAYLLYRKVEDTITVKNNVIDNFRIFGRKGTLWGGYTGDTYLYNPYDIRLYFKQYLYASKRIQLNYQVLEKIETGRIQVLSAFLQSIRNNPTDLLRNANLTSQNNRIYAFFTNPKLIPSTEADDPDKIQKFNDNFMKDALI